MAPDRRELLRRAYEASFYFGDFQQWEAAFDGWEIDPIQIQGETAGVVFHNGPAFHFCKFTQAPVGRDILRRYPGELIAKYGYATTTTPKWDTRQQRFNERIGMTRTGETELVVLYRIDIIRSNLCQQQQSPGQCSQAPNWRSVD